MARPKKDTCKNGHPMKDPNLIKHNRLDPKTNQIKVVVECRECANARYRVLRAARRRNAKLLKGRNIDSLPKDFGKLDIPSDLGKPFACDPESSTFTEETIRLLKWKPKSKRQSEIV